MLHLQKIFWTNIHPTFLGSLIHQSQVKTGRLQKIYCHSNLFTSQQKMDKFVTRKPTESDSSEDEASLPSKRRITRLRFSEHEKERYGKMSLHDKRKLYKCGSEYETIQNIPTWSEEAAESGKCVSLKQEAKGETYLADDTINSKVSVWRGDITRCEIDAIVNAANETLLGGGGVDGAIHSAAGPYLKSECATLKGCETGDAKITLGYNLPAKYVIHTVGPKGENPVKLESCYNRSLACMKEYELRSIAFPCISTGIYGYPNHAAAKVALKTVRTFLEENKDEVDRVIFCLFLPVDIKLYNQYMMEYFPPEKEDD